MAAEFAGNHLGQRGAVFRAVGLRDGAQLAVRVRGQAGGYGVFVGARAACCCVVEVGDGEFDLLGDYGGGFGGAAGGEEGGEEVAGFEGEVGLDVWEQGAGVGSLVWWVDVVSCLLVVVVMILLVVLFCWM